MTALSTFKLSANHVRLVWVIGLQVVLCNSPPATELPSSSRRTQPMNVPTTPTPSSFPSSEPSSASASSATGARRAKSISFEEASLSSSTVSRIAEVQANVVTSSVALAAGVSIVTSIVASATGNSVAVAGTGGALLLINHVQSFALVSQIACAPTEVVDLGKRLMWSTFQVAPPWYSSSSLTWSGDYDSEPSEGAASTAMELWTGSGWAAANATANATQGSSSESSSGMGRGEQFDRDDAWLVPPETRFEGNLFYMCILLLLVLVHAGLTRLHFRYSGRTLENPRVLGIGVIFLFPISEILLLQILVPSLSTAAASVLLSSTARIWHLVLAIAVLLSVAVCICVIFLYLKQMMTGLDYGPAHLMQRLALVYRDADGPTGLLAILESAEARLQHLMTLPQSAVKIDVNSAQSKGLQHSAVKIDFTSPQAELGEMLQVAEARSRYFNSLPQSGVGNVRSPPIALWGHSNSNTFSHGNALSPPRFVHSCLISNAVPLESPNIDFRNAPSPSIASLYTNTPCGSPSNSKSLSPLHRRNMVSPRSLFDFATQDISSGIDFAHSNDISLSPLRASPSGFLRNHLRNNAVRLENAVSPAIGVCSPSRTNALPPLRRNNAVPSVAQAAFVSSATGVCKSAAETELDAAHKEFQLVCKSAAETIKSLQDPSQEACDKVFAARERLAEAKKNLLRSCLHSTVSPAIVVCAPSIENTGSSPGPFLHSRSRSNARSPASPQLVTPSRLGPPIKLPNLNLTPALGTRIDKWSLIDAISPKTPFVVSPCNMNAVTGFQSGANATPHELLGMTELAADGIWLLPPSGPVRVFALIFESWYMVYRGDRWRMAVITHCATLANALCLGLMIRTPYAQIVVLTLFKLFVVMITILWQPKRIRLARWFDEVIGATALGVLVGLAFSSGGTFPWLSLVVNSLFVLQILLQGLFNVIECYFRFKAMLAPTNVGSRAPQSPIIHLSNTSSPNLEVWSCSDSKASESPIMHLSSTGPPDLEVWSFSDNSASEKMTSELPRSWTLLSRLVSPPQEVQLGSYEQWSDSGSENDDDEMSTTPRISPKTGSLKASPRQSRSPRKETPRQEAPMASALSPCQEIHIKANAQFSGSSSSEFNEIDSDEM